MPWEKIEHTRRKTVVLPLYQNDLSQFRNCLYQIYNDKNFTFKLTFEFSFLLVLSEDARIIGNGDRKGHPELKNICIS